MNKTIFVIVSIVILFLIGIAFLQQNTIKNNLSPQTTLNVSPTNQSSAKNVQAGFNFTPQQIPAFNFPSVAYADNLNNKTTIYNSKGEKMDANIAVAKNGNGSAFTLSPSSSFIPGKYTLIVDDNGKQFKQDFTWGVLAINTNKSVYLPNETASLALAVLDQKGNMVCNASVTLQITDPNGAITTLSTNDGTIIVNPECQMKKMTNKPDYQANYQVKNAGIYKMNLTAISPNGTYSIADKFTVQNSVPFDVERTTATRIFPYNPYPVSLKITANQDFTGTIKETVPEAFKITPLLETPGYEKVEDNTTDKTITWNISLQKGQVITLGYNYTPPNVSPEFYLLGPLTFYDQNKILFQESRRWQIASDVGIAYVQEVAVLPTSGVNGTAFSPAHNTTQGNHLILLASNTGGSIVVSSVTDTKGNTWQIDSTQANTSVASTSIASVYLTTALTTSDTITVTLSGTGTFRGGLLEEYSGLTTTSWKDVNAGNTGADSTSMTTGTTAATGQANELTIEAFCLQATATSFTKDTNYSNFTTQIDGRMGGAYRILTSIGTQNATGAFGNTGTNWAGAIATYKAAATTSPSFRFQGLQLSGIKLN
jgi:hypothetical protein